MSFKHLNRRFHLYAGLVLAPWVLLYAISSVVFSHNRYFDERDKAKGAPAWFTLSEEPFDAAVPDDSTLREFGRKILEEHGIEGAFGVYRQGQEQINIYVHRIWSSTQLKYMVREKRLIIQAKRFRLDHALTGFHAKGGFDQDRLRDDAWAIAVDAICVGFLVWVASGFYMWMESGRRRVSGSIALGSGVLLFAVLVAVL